ALMRVEIGEQRVVIAHEPDRTGRVRRLPLMRRWPTHFVVARRIGSCGDAGRPRVVFAASQLRSPRGPPLGRVPPAATALAGAGPVSDGSCTAASRGRRDHSLLRPFRARPKAEPESAPRRSGIAECKTAPRDRQGELARSRCPRRPVKLTRKFSLY